MTEKLKGISGSMFAGKTEELISEITRAEIAKRHVLVFKPRLDDRWGKIDKVRAHSGSEHDAFPVSSPQEILDLVAQYLEINHHLDLVAIDEIQFMPESVVDVIKILLEMDIRVIFAGLAQDFRGEPFGSMPTLLALCDEINKPTAICTEDVNGKPCGQPATKTQRLIDGKPAKYTDPIVLVGGEDEGYHARCPNHHVVPGKPKPNLK
jgi:thymidine kinase